MKNTLQSIFTIKNSNYLYLVLFLLLFPALLINLGTMPLLADEPTRALVALEMYISKNYIVPTINGDYYYNKPPLYNWLLVGLYHITGRMDEWIVRFPTVFSIFLYGGIILYWVRKYADLKTAVFVILAYITCGRVLFYDSFLGLIDTLFAALIFLNFMFLYHFDRKNDYKNLFLMSYLIMTVCFFLKGLPALVFQGVSITTLLYLRGKLRMLFSFYHVLGVLLFVLFAGVYYSFYLRYNSLDTLFQTLIQESTKRTVAHNAWYKSILHLVTFPFETIGHFLPWTAPLVLFIKKENRNYVKNNDFLNYLLWIGLANLVVYWLSPETRPRYLFMFLPCFFILSYSLIQHQLNSRFTSGMETILLVILMLLCSACLLIPVIPLPPIDYFYLKIVGLFFFLVTVLVFYYYNQGYRLLLFCAALLIVRIGFNWFVIPSRMTSEVQISYRTNGIYVGKYTKGEELVLYKYTPMNHDASFYISRERGKILGHDFRGTGDNVKIKKGVFYLAKTLEGELARGTIHHQFRVADENSLIYLVKVD